LTKEGSVLYIVYQSMNSRIKHKI